METGVPTNLVYPFQLPIPGRHLPPTPPIGPGGTCEEAGLKPLRLNCDRRLGTSWKQTQT
jgi:hypothetical protein